MRRIVITADDFGFSETVNEAVERGFRDGVLRCASLMVAAPAAADAITRAQRLPGLRIGLHVTVVQGRALLAPSEIPHLVDTDGNFPDNLLRAALRWFFHRGSRCDLAREIAAQFAAFRATGLTLDHVNGHNHMHLHPSVLSEILRNLPPGSTAVRLPREPVASAGLPGVLLAPWLALMALRLRRAGLAHNNWLLGVRDVGRVDEARLLGYLDNLPAGDVEIHLHPAVGYDAAVAAAMPGYFNEAEFSALISPTVAQRLRTLAFRPGGFVDFRDP